MTKLTTKERTRCLLELIVLFPLIIYCIWKITRQKLTRPDGE